MRDTTKKYFDDAISILNRMGVKNENITVCGSVALDIYGLLPENHNIHDFDCIVHIDKEHLGLFNLLCEIYKDESFNSEYTDEYQKMVKIDGILLNIWVNVPTNELYLKYNGIRINNIIDILNEKKRYNRTKDYKDIIGIVNKILN